MPPPARRAPWGLRGRVFRRVAVAWILVATLAAWAGDDSSCCCDCRGAWARLASPDAPELEPIAERHLRESPEVRAAVGAITDLVIERDPFDAPSVETHWNSADQKIAILTYEVRGASASTKVTLYLRERGGSWEVAAMRSADGAITVGEIPEFVVSSGGDWD